MWFNYETTLHSCELSFVDGSLVCPTCRQDCPTSCVIDNLFINNLNMGVAAAEGGQSNSSADEQKICTACEEGSPVSSYCIDCADWLCDQCVQAHRRVRMTKDHVIQTKDAMASNDIKPPSHSSMMHCKVVFTNDRLCCSKQLYEILNLRVPLNSLEIYRSSSYYFCKVVK